MLLELLLLEIRLNGTEGGTIVGRVRVEVVRVVGRNIRAVVVLLVDVIRAVGTVMALLDMADDVLHVRAVVALVPGTVRVLKGRAVTIRLGRNVRAVLVLIVGRLVRPGRNVRAVVPEVIEIGDAVGVVGVVGVVGAIGVAGLIGWKSRAARL